MQVKNEATRERRRGCRFPIQLAIHYERLNSPVALHGMGTTMDFSRSGIAFTTEDHLPVGSMIRASVDWPAKLDGHCALKFIAFGHVVRSDGGHAAVTIQTHNFRTRGNTSLAQGLLGMRLWPEMITLQARGSVIGRGCRN